VGLASSWPMVVAVFLPATSSLGVRVEAAYLVMVFAGDILNVVRFAAGKAAEAGTGSQLAW